MRRLGHTISLAMIDIDHFKTVNDTYGHATGDRVLRSLSRLLSQRMRQTDVVGRYGGEEFAVIMVGANAENARGRHRQSARGVGATAAFFQRSRVLFDFFGGRGGRAAARNGGQSVRNRRDNALYSAKGAGRNQVALGE